MGNILCWAYRHQKLAISTPDFSYTVTLSWQTEEKNRVEQTLSVYVFLEFLATMRCSPYPLAPYFSKLYQSKSPGVKVCGKLYVVFINTQFR